MNFKHAEHSGTLVIYEKLNEAPIAISVQIFNTSQVRDAFFQLLCAPQSIISPMASCKKMISLSPNPLYEAAMSVEL